ncbi:DUF4214 domain-containing protein [Sulfurimonas sp. NWX367]|uniref:DUF4214 domain-containing protein n=1 Tax=Sulfurimonas sp. NWX367 TaxID=2925413 RepID=UPI0032046CB2
MATIKEQLTQLYIAYFNRAPDADGLTYWLDQMQNTGMDYDAIAQNWSTEQQEFTDLYGDNLTNDEFVAKVYEHVLGRAPDADGLAYWSSELSSGTLNTGNLVQAVVAGASAPTGSLTDALTLTNRTDAGLTLANAGINNIDLAKKVVLAVNHKPETVSIAKSVISIAAKEVEQAGGEDAADLSGAITTLDTVHTMLTDTTQATTLDNTLANLETLLQKTEEAVVAGTVTDVASVLAATATTVEAASVDPTFVENPDTLATSLVENPDSVVTEATTTIEDANNPTPTPTPPPPPPADTTPPTMLSAVVNSDGDVVITYSESVASSTVEAGDYAVSIDGTSTTPVAATVSTNTVTLTMPTKILASSTVTDVVYTASNGTANSIKDASGNAAIDQTLATVTNNSIWYTIAELTAATPTPTTYAVLDTAANAAADASTGTYITGNINVTLTDAATIAQLTTIDAATSGTLTYTAITDTAANLATNTGGYLTGAVNATVTDTGSVAAADLNTIDAATTGTVDASNVSTVTGISSDVTALVTSGVILSGSEAITLTDAAGATVAAADLAAIDAATGGTVTITNVNNSTFTVTGSLTDVSTIVSLLGATTAITLTDTTVAAADVNTLDASVGTIDATAATTITGNLADVNTFISNVTYTNTANVTLSDTTLAAADVNTLDASVGTIDATAATTITGTTTDVKALIDANTVFAPSVNITLTDAANATVAAADLAAIDAATGGTVTITNSVIINGTADGSSTADAIDVSGITFTSSAVTINGNDGDDKIIGGIEADTINGGDGNDIIRGGAGVDTINGDAGDDTFVVLGVIGASDYTTADVTSNTGAYALGLANLIDTGLTTSDSGLNADGVTYDGSGETYAGGTGTNVIEVWGNANLANATVSNINSFDVHSDLTLSASQLLYMLNTDGIKSTLNLMDATSTVNITGVTQSTGLALLQAFTPAMDIANMDLTQGSMPTIAFDLYSLSNTTATSYTIKPEDIVDLANLANGTQTTLQDAGGENSVMSVAPGSTITTVNASDGNDIIVAGNMSSSVTVDGGADDDILVYASQAATDLDHVTNVEIISLSGGAATITTVDGFNDINVQQAGVTINAKDITGALTFDASAETSSSGTITAAGFFTVMGSAQADTITGGDGSDTFYADDTDVIDGGSNYTLDRANGSNGDTVIFDAAVASANLLDTNLANIETIVVTDIGADGTEVYDFSAQSESLFINVVAGKDNAGADITTGTTIKGGTAADTIIGGAGDDTITGDAGDDIIILGAGADTVTVDAGTDSLSNLATADTLTVNASAIANITSANGNILDMTTLTGYTNNGTVVLNNTGGATAAIKGGAGIEQIIAGANGDTITGGAGADAITMGTGNDTAIIAAAGDTGTLTYSDVDSSGTVNDTDTVTGAFDVITSFTTYASNNNADGDDLVISSVNSASASGDILTGLNANEYQILQGTWDATNAKFTIDSTNGTDQLIAFDDGTNDVAVVLLGITDFDATQDFGQ